MTHLRTTEMHALAEKFRYEIAHRHDQRFVARVVHPIDSVVHAFFLRKTYLSGMEFIRSIPEDTPVILSSVHKSHLDYIILGTSLYLYADKLMPATIAGKNLFHGLFHSMLPRLKSVCLDRERVKPKNLRSRENLLYLSTFYDYLMEDVVHTGDMISIFPEGGRSYDGAIHPLSLGVFGIAKRALNLGKSHQVAIIPIGISYERVTEDARYSGLQKYKQQSAKTYRAYDKRGFLQHAIFQPTSRAYIDIGTPMYVTDTRHMDALEQELRSRMGHLIRVTPVSLVCRALRGATSMPLKELFTRMHADMQYARENGILLARGMSYRTTGRIFKKSFTHLANRMRMRDIIRVEGSFRKTVIVHRADIVDYYANTVAHLFPESSALTAE